MAARLNPRIDERHRQYIQTTQLVKRLQSFIKGEIEMVPHQVTAVLGLLKKTLPDLAAVQHTGKVEVLTRAVEMGDDELASIAFRGSNGAAKTAEDPTQLH